MTCKDCVHYEVCGTKHFKEVNENSYPKIQYNCAHFKPKSRFVELPCEVGQTVYYFSHYPFNLSVLPNTVYEAHVVRIVITKLGASLVIQIHNEQGVTEIPHINSFGKNVFLSREEAEKLNNNGKD